MKKTFRILVCFLGLVPIPSLGCTCVDPGPDSEDKIIEAFCSVDLIFIGQAGSSPTGSDYRNAIEIEAVKILKGSLRKTVVAERYTTCDHWFSAGDDYLVFGNIEEGSNRILTSICGPFRYTSRLDYASEQLRIAKEVAAEIPSVCGELESTERRLRILRENRKPSEVDVDLLLKETQSLQDDID